MSSTARWSCRRLTFLCRRWRTSWWRRAGTSMYLILEQATEVPKISSSSRHPCRRRVLRVRRRRNSWWKCLRSCLFLFCVRLWGRTWTFQFLMVVAVGLGREVFKVSHCDRIQQRFVVQSTLTFQFRVVVLMVLVLDRGSTASSFHSRGASDKAITGFFRTLPPRRNKSEVPPRVRVRECTGTRAHPRRGANGQDTPAHDGVSFDGLYQVDAGRLWSLVFRDGHKYWWNTHTQHTQWHYPWES